MILTWSWLEKNFKKSQLPGFPGLQVKGQVSQGFDLVQKKSLKKSMNKTFRIEAQIAHNILFIQY